MLLAASAAWAQSRNITGIVFVHVHKFLVL